MSWTKDLAAAYTHPKDLADCLSLSIEEQDQLAKLVKQYPMRVPRYYLSLVDPSDPEDPIRRMCIPALEERGAGGVIDSSGERENTVMTGMQHKYPQTLLVLSNNQCAMYCRHCFRKRMVGLNMEETTDQVSSIAAYVKAHSEINNVLISGGDSFMNENILIKAYLDQFSEIDHLDFIRFGTRIPVVLPQRILEDSELLALLEQYGRKKQIIVVTQFNHPRELTQEACRAVLALQKAGCIIRNQTVLLKGVNDHAGILAELLNKLTKFGVIPYYIFQCRPVLGVQNQFQVPLLYGSELVETAKAMVNGQAKSVRFVMAHENGKIEILGQSQVGEMLFKFHQAKEPHHASHIFTKRLTEADRWLEGIQ